jgi:hypothetical protein
MSYLQPIPKNLDKLKPAITHGYIDTVPTTDFTVLGKPARSASELRSQYAILTTEQRKAFIKDLFGKYDDAVYNIMNNKLIAVTPTTDLTENQKKLLKKLIMGVLKEDVAKIQSAKKKRNDAELALCEVELEGAVEDLKNANDVLKSVTAPDQKDAAEASVKIKKALVDSKKVALQSAQSKINSI